MMPRKLDTTHQQTTTCLTPGTGLEEDNFPTDQGSVGIVSGWLKHLTSIVPFISNLLPSPIWQEVPVCGPKVRDPITHHRDTLATVCTTAKKLPETHTYPHQALPLGAPMKINPSLLSSQPHSGSCSPIFLHLLVQQSLPTAGPEDTGFLSAWTGPRVFQKLKPQCVLRTTTSCLCPLSQASSRTQSRGDSQIQVNQSCDDNWPCRRPQVTMRFLEKRLWVLRPTWCVAGGPTWFHRWVGLLGSVR